MKLDTIKISGLRKLKEMEVSFGDTTFLIGENNVGKSTVFQAIKLLLTKANAGEHDFTQRFCEEQGANIRDTDCITITGRFTNLPKGTNTWPGFKGRVFKDNGDSCIIYRKTFSSAGKPKIEMYQKRKELRKDVMVDNGSKVTITSLVGVGLNEDDLKKVFTNVKLDQNLNTKTYLPKLEEITEAWDYKDEYDWFENPGGIPQNVMSKLPKLIYIPAEHKADEIDCKQTSALGEIMTTIFDEIIEKSENYAKVKECFDELEKEIDTEDDKT